MRHRSLVILIALLLTAVPLFASHGWSNYHWGRSCSTCAVAITVYDSTITTNTSWPTHLNRAIFGDASNPNTANRRGWDNSSILTLSIAQGSTTSTTRSSCPAVNATVRVCNYTYGSNGWLGLAQINLVSGSSHIAWGTAKMNDSYFNGSYPNTEKRHVMCQEVGHDFGLGHTSENGSSQNTCMDYYSNTSNTDWTSTGPNQHDFDQILTQHHYGAKLFIPDNIATVPMRFPGDGELNEPWQWGTPVEWDAQGRAVTYFLSLGVRADHEDGEEGEDGIVTHVYWAEPDAVAVEQERTIEDRPTRER